MKARRFSASNKHVWYISFLTLLIIILTGHGWRRCLEYISYPFLIGQQSIANSLRQWRLRHQTQEALYVQLEKLAEERNELLKKIIEYKGVRNYMFDAGEALEFKKRYAPEATLVAQILLKHLADDGQYLYIDAGENRGLTKDKVVIYDNCLLGRITEVYSHYSKVVLITDKECHVAASCSETKARGIHSGLNTAHETVVEFVSHLDTLHEGDIVFSHGEGLIFPRGFALGKVKSFELQGVQYRVRVEPLLDFEKITHCLVLLRY
jgi:rod shape-determining protein MreC